jgi:hypothetical protein
MYEDIPLTISWKTRILECPGWTTPTTTVSSRLNLIQIKLSITFLSGF